VTGVNPQTERNDSAAQRPRVGTSELGSETMSAGGGQPSNSNSEAETLLAAELLQRVAAEMDRLVALVMTVEHALPTMLSSRMEAASTETLAALQQLDLIAQTVAALSHFLRAVTPVSPEDRIHVSAGLKLITLFDLSARLGVSKEDHASGTFREGQTVVNPIAGRNRKTALGVELF
jgi:hypothetical protein